jgi:hypothetical protein
MIGQPWRRARSLPPRQRPQTEWKRLGRAGRADGRAERGFAPGSHPLSGYRSFQSARISAWCRMTNTFALPSAAGSRTPCRSARGPPAEGTPRFCPTDRGVSERSRSATSARGGCFDRSTQPG